MKQFNFLFFILEESLKPLEGNILDHSPLKQSLPTSDIYQYDQHHLLP